MQIPEIPNQYRKNTRNFNIKNSVNNPKDKTKSEVDLELAMRSLASINKPKVAFKSQDTKENIKTNNGFRISKQLSEQDIDCLCTLGEIHNKALSETGDKTSEAFSEKYSPKSRGFNIRESYDVTKPSSGLRYGIYDNGNEIILAVDGLQNGNKQDKKQMLYYMSENTKFPGKKFLASRAESKQLEELENIYKHWIKQSKKEGKKLTVSGYSLGGAMVKSVAGKHLDDTSTRFVTFNAFATENTKGLAEKDLPNVISHYISGDKLSNARGFFSGKLFAGPKQGGISTTISEKHNLEAFLHCDDTNKEYNHVWKPGFAS